jgi:transketolase
LQKTLQLLKLKTLELYYKANAGHIGCSLSCIDLMGVILLQHFKGNDKFILSKGHAAASMYACLSHLGEISEEVLDTFYKNGTVLSAHPAPNKFKSIPFATGSLGHGFPIATGIAKAKKLKNEKSHVYVLMSDGETNEGTTWEAAHFAVFHKLNNLIVVIDKNGLQGFGKTEDIFGDTAAFEKWQAIGFEILEINGHDINQIDESISQLEKSNSTSPKLIIANTIKGKGIKYMENKMEWHYLPMTEELYKEAVQDINKEYSA